MINTLSDDEKIKIIKRLTFMIKQIRLTGMMSEEKEKRCNNAMTRLLELKKKVHAHHPYGILADLIERAT